MVQDGNVARNNSSAKAFGGVAAILAVVAGIYAMTEPMSQRVDFLERQIGTMRTEMLEHGSRQAHPGMLQLYGQHSERFKEVETQFRSLRDLSDLQFTLLRNGATKATEWRERHDLHVAPLNAAQWERIRALERKVYGQPGKVTSGMAEGAD